MKIVEIAHWNRLKFAQYSCVKLARPKEWKQKIDEELIQIQFQFIGRNKLINFQSINQTWKLN